VIVTTLPVFSGVVDFGLVYQGSKKTTLRHKLMQGSVSDIEMPLNGKIWRLVGKRLDQKRHAVRKSQHSRKDFEAYMRQGTE